MSLEELENLFKNVKTCPSCGSKEGFWLAAQLYKKFMQCKNCGVIIEFHDVMQNEDKRKSRGIKILGKK